MLLVINVVPSIDGTGIKTRKATGPVGTAHIEDPPLETVRAQLHPRPTRALTPAETTGKRHQTPPIGTFTTPDETTVKITARQRHTVALLSADATDAQVSKALGVSVRTVRKDVAELMSRFSVRSRFALGGAIARYLIEHQPSAPILLSKQERG